jgi:hypothetical protein
MACVKIGLQISLGILGGISLSISGAIWIKISGILKNISSSLISKQYGFDVI